jgi:membrane protease YdiL (CAAX protease family)
MPPSIGDPVDPADAGPGRPARHRQLLELLVFLFLIVPSMVLAQFAYRQERASFGLVAWATIARDLALVCLILYFLWQNRESIRAIGWRFRGREMALGLVLFAPFSYLAGLTGRAFHAMGLSLPSNPASFLVPHGTADFVLAGVLVAVVAVAEETIFRGYLILRLTGVGSGIVGAVLISAFIFSLGHGYEGSAGLATVGVMGIGFALVYLWRRSLVAPMTMHFLQDFIGIVILPLYQTIARHH